MRRTTTPRGAPEREAPSVVGRDLAHGLVASVPLFVLYELGLAAGASEVGRNSAELLLGKALAGLGDYESLARRLLLVALALLALAKLWRSGAPVFRDALRQMAEGLFAAIALGPLLVVCMSWLGVGLMELDPGHGGHGGPRVALSLAGAARLVGGAVWEELLFRVGVYGVIYLSLARLTVFFGAPRSAGAVLGELGALLGSALVFAAIHLEAVAEPLGLGGERFDPGVFLWRTLAGISLAGLFRWRGLGVAAWAHGLFNFALALGSGPGVLRGGS